MGAFLQPTSVGLMVLAVVLAVAATATTALFWDRGGRWITLRFLGPLASFGSLALATLDRGESGGHPVLQLAGRLELPPVSPDSLAFQIVVLLALLGVLAVAILRWKRFRHPVAARFAALMLVQIFAIGAVLVAANRSGHYLTTWATVAGSEAGIDPQTILDTPGSGDRPSGPHTWQVTPAERAQDRADARSSRLETITVTGAATGYDLPATVYLPGSYSAAGTAGTAGAGVR